MHAIHTNRFGVPAMDIVYQYNIYATEHLTVQMAMTRIWGYAQQVNIICFIFSIYI